MTAMTVEPLPPLSAPTTEARDRAIPQEIQERAAHWPLFLDIDDAPHAPRLAGAFLRCAECTQGVVRLAWGVPTPASKVKLRRTAAEVQTAVLAHVLMVHRRSVDPEWSGS